MHTIYFLVTNKLYSQWQLYNKRDALQLLLVCNNSCNAFTIFSFWQIAFVNNIHDFYLRRSFMRSRQFDAIFQLAPKKVFLQTSAGPFFLRGRSRSASKCGSYTGDSLKKKKFTNTKFWLFSLRLRKRFTNKNFSFLLRRGSTCWQMLGGLDMENTCRFFNQI